jgi:CRP-like cAMP-binding protein
MMMYENLAILKQSNAILAGLPLGDWERWKKFLSPVVLEVDQVIHQAGQVQKHIYLPASCIVSVQYDFEDGNSAEFAEIGNEGLTGTFIFMGNTSTVSQSTVIAKGLAYRADVSFVQHEFNSSSSFRRQILNYMQLLMLYTAQTAVCNRRHSITQQLARVLLVNLDRITGTDLEFTHELIAKSLGVRREGITQSAQHLQSRGDIEYARGHITVKNRSGLLRSSCECYRIVKEETDRLLFENSHTGSAT